MPAHQISGPPPDSWHLARHCLQPSVLFAIGLACTIPFSGTRDNVLLAIAIAITRATAATAVIQDAPDALAQSFQTFYYESAKRRRPRNGLAESIRSGPLPRLIGRIQRVVSGAFYLFECGTQSMAWLQLLA